MQTLRKWGCCCFPCARSWQEAGYCSIINSNDNAENESPPEAYIYMYNSSRSKGNGSYKNVSAKLRNIWKGRIYDMDSLQCNRKNIPIFVVCLHQTRPVEDLEGALEDIAGNEDEQLCQILFIYIIPDDKYLLRLSDIPADYKCSKYLPILKIYNYSEKKQDDRRLIAELQQDISKSDLYQQ